MMRRILFLTGMAVGAGVLSENPAMAQTPTPIELYQRALVEDQAAGNLSEAIEIYRQVAQSAGDNRRLGAEALIHAAAAYEKLAAPEAEELYAAVLSTYPEQTESVTLAQARLEALGTLATSRPPAAQDRRTDVSAVVDPVLANSCVGCHNSERRTAGLVLENANTRNVAENPELWENVLRRLRADTMPPAGTPRIDSRRSVVSALELALDQAYPAVNSSARVDDMELASRMASWIWGSDADARLLEVAGQGRLRDPSILGAEVRRMLEDPRSTHLVTAFFETWLAPLRRLDGMERDPELYPEFDDALVRSFRRETRLFFEHQLRGDRPAMELWTADYTFLDARLARHYGISGVVGDTFRQVTLPDNRRGGLLGQGSLLAATSQTARTSPTIRGITILRYFLGENPPDPPAGVAPLVEDARDVRTRLEAHVSNPACAACHRMFDPLGMALENFDALGQWRTSDAGIPIDASGALINGTAFSGPAQLRAALIEYRESFLNHMTGSLLVNALGRENARNTPYAYEMPAVRAILREAAASDYRWSAIVAGIVRSAPFQMEELVP